jgi:hypothetical protein
MVRQRSALPLEASKGRFQQSTQDHQTAIAALRRDPR